MTINIITSGVGQIAAEDRISYEKELLTNLYPEIYYPDYGKKKTLPANEGTTLNFRRPSKYTVGTPVALSEGITPVGTAFTYTPVTCIPNQYGNYSIFSDRIKLQGIDDNIEDASKELGKWAGLAADVIVRNVTIATTNIQYQGGKTAITDLDNTCKLTVTGIKKMRRTLRTANVKPFADGNYVLLVDADSEHDISEDPDWKEFVKFSAPDRAVKGEIGIIFGVKVVITNNNYVALGGGATTNLTGIKKTAVAGTDTADVHYAMMFGQEAYGVVDLGKSEPEMFIKTASEGGTADPLEQRNTVGTKFYQGAVILDDLRMVCCRYTVSA